MLLELAVRCSGKIGVVMVPIVHRPINASDFTDGGSHGVEAWWMFG